MRILAAAALLALAPAGVSSLGSEPGAEDIVVRAHQAAGGPDWVNPRTLYMEGYGLFWRSGPEPVRYEPYRMWRVYPETKTDARAADGRVRIDALSDGDIAFQIGFDGRTTWNQDGPVESGEADAEWASNFGFGAIRFALDEGYDLERLPDDLVDGRPAHVVRVTDPGGAKTVFAIAADDAQILRVGFDTPRGWHERVYSDFYEKDGVDWVQPGRVRLYYDGVKTNEIVWTDFQLNAPMAPALFSPDPQTRIDPPPD